jgi:hypothetical protein
MTQHEKSKVNLDDLTIGDRVFVNLHHGPNEEALIKAIIPTTGGKRSQVDFGCPSPKCGPARLPLKSATFKKMKVKPRQPGDQI